MIYKNQTHCTNLLRSYGKKALFRLRFFSEKKVTLFSRKMPLHIPRALLGCSYIAARLNY